jgi:hypothetical protein
MKTKFGNLPLRHQGDSLPCTIIYILRAHTTASDGHVLANHVLRSDCTTVDDVVHTYNAFALLRETAQKARLQQIRAIQKQTPTLSTAEAMRLADQCQVTLYVKPAKASQKAA